MEAERGGARAARERLAWSTSRSRRRRAMAARAARNMKLQCTIQDGHVWLADDEVSLAIEPVVRKARAVRLVRCALLALGRRSSRRLRPARARSCRGSRPTPSSSPSATASPSARAPRRTRPIPRRWSGSSRARWSPRGCPARPPRRACGACPAVLEEVRPQLLILCHGGNDFLRKTGRGHGRGQRARDDPPRAGPGHRGAARRHAEAGLRGLEGEVLRGDRQGARDPRGDRRAGRRAGSRKFKSDLVHPNAEGYALIAEAVARFCAPPGRSGTSGGHRIAGRPVERRVYPAPPGLRHPICNKSAPVRSTRGSARRRSGSEAAPRGGSPRSRR